MTIAARFAPPAGFERVPTAERSFASSLRALRLKPDGSPVRLFSWGDLARFRESR